MITTVILYVLYGAVWLITLPIRTLADASLPEGIAGAITAVNGYLGGLALIVPVGTLFAAFAVILAAEAAVLAYKGIMWLIKRLPTQS